MRHAKRQKIDNSNIAKMVYASDSDNCEITDLMSVNHQCLNFAKKKSVILYSPWSWKSDR